MDRIALFLLPCFVDGGLKETFETFSNERLGHVGGSPADVWRAYIPAHPPVRSNDDADFLSEVRRIAILYGFDVSSKSTSDIYIGQHAEKNIFTRTSGELLLSWMHMEAFKNWVVS